MVIRTGKTKDTYLNSSHREVNSISVRKSIRPHFMPGISFPGVCAMTDALLIACQNMNDDGSFGGPWLSDIKFKIGQSVGDAAEGGGKILHEEEPYAIIFRCAIVRQIKTLISDLISRISILPFQVGSEMDVRPHRNWHPSPL